LRFQLLWDETAAIEVHDFRQASFAAPDAIFALRSTLSADTRPILKHQAASLLTPSSTLQVRATVINKATSRLDLTGGLITSADQHGKLQGAANLVLTATMVTDAVQHGKLQGAAKLALTATMVADTLIFATAVLLGGQSGPDVNVNFSSATDAGSLVGAITVTTNIAGSTYIGTITIGGTDAAKFSLSSNSNVSSAAYPCSLYVSQSNIAVGTYVITLTATP
jgi:hypothetical protein